MVLDEGLFHEMSMRQRRFRNTHSFTGSYRVLSSGVVGSSCGYFTATNVDVEERAKDVLEGMVCVVGHNPLR